MTDLTFACIMFSLIIVTLVFSSINDWYIIKQQKIKIIDLQKEIEKLEDDYKKQNKEFVVLQKSKDEYKQKFEFMQTHKPKYNLGEKIGDYTIAKLDVKQRSLIGLGISWFKRAFFGVADTSNKFNDRFIYHCTTRSVLRKRLITKIFEEWELDEIKPKPTQKRHKK